MKGLYDCRRCSLSYQDCECDILTKPEWKNEEMSAATRELDLSGKRLVDEWTLLLAVESAARECKLARESGFRALWTVPLAADRLEVALAALDAFRKSRKAPVQPDDDV